MTRTDKTRHTGWMKPQGSWLIYLLVFLWAISEEDAFLHVAVQNLLYSRHVTFNDILHLDEWQQRQCITETLVSFWCQGCLCWQPSYLTSTERKWQSWERKYKKREGRKSGRKALYVPFHNMQRTKGGFLKACLLFFFWALCPYIDQNVLFKGV